MLIPADVMLFRTAKPCECAVAVTPAAAAAAAASAMDFVERASPVIAYGLMFGLRSFNEILLFGSILLLNHQDCFLFHCEWYEMKQCLVPCLLSSNFSQKAMTICLLLIEFRFDAYYR